MVARLDKEIGECKERKWTTKCCQSEYASTGQTFQISIRKIKQIQTKKISSLRKLSYRKRGQRRVSYFFKYFWLYLSLQFYKTVSHQVYRILPFQKKKNMGFTWQTKRRYISSKRFFLAKNINSRICYICKYEKKIRSYPKLK